MKAFNDDDSVREAFHSAAAQIITRAQSYPFRQILSRGNGGVEQLAGYVFRGIPGNLSYERLGFPEKLFLLTLAIAGELPEAKRQPWLERFIKSVGVGADLEEMQIWGQFIEWLLLHPLSGAINDIARKSARDAVKEVARLVLEESTDRHEWYSAGMAVNQAKHKLFADAEAKGELTSTMGSGVPAIAAIYMALGVVNLGWGVKSRANVEILVEMAARSVSIDQIAEGLIALVLGVTL
jgi:hypothetical protein